MNLKSSFLDHFEPLSMNRVAPAYTLVFHNKINPTRNFGSSILLTLSIFIRHEHCQHVHCWRSTDVVLSSRSGNTGISTLSSLSDQRDWLLSLTHIRVIMVDGLTDYHVKQTRNSHPQR